MLLIFEVMIFPSREENIFFILDSVFFLVIAVIAGPFPDTDAAIAPFSIKSVMIFGSEFRIVDAANPLTIIASQ